MDWSIQEVARLAGTTSRTLRHYGELGLLTPSRVGANGYRHYDERALARLQRILLLRQLGLGLPAIAEALGPDRGRAGAGADADADASGAASDDWRPEAARALGTHLEWLRAEQNRLARQIASVENTITTMTGEGRLMAEQMFDGFDHTEHQGEVTERWGADSYASGDAWWRFKTDAERSEWQRAQSSLAEAWAEAAVRGVDPGSEEAQALAARQYEWLRGIPGLPGDADGPATDYVVGLGELYVADERFAANYRAPGEAAGSTRGAEFVRDTLREWGRRLLAE